LSLKWTKGPDLPFRMDGYIQSVVIEDTLYVGGGSAGRGNNCTIMAYHTHTQNWHKLKPFPACNFAMVAANNSQLILAGGIDKRGCVTNTVGGWDDGSKKWTFSYSPMPTPASAAACDRFVVVAGGRSMKEKLTTVEVLDTLTNMWCASPPMPSPWSSMKSAVVGDMWYVMGGFSADEAATDAVYGVSLPALLFHSNSKPSSDAAASPSTIWKALPSLRHTSSAPVSIGGKLFAVGGVSNNDVARVSAMFYFDNEASKWILAGQLLAPTSQCSCTVSANGLMFLTGSHELTFYIGTLG